MEILTKRPAGMTQKDWRQYCADLKVYVKRRISAPIWFAKGVKVPHRPPMPGETFLPPKYLIQPMGTYYHGMQTLAQQ